MKKAIIVSMIIVLIMKFQSIEPAFKNMDSDILNSSYGTDKVLFIEYFVNGHLFRKNLTENFREKKENDDIDQKARVVFNNQLEFYRKYLKNNNEDQRCQKLVICRLDRTFIETLKILSHFITSLSNYHEQNKCLVHYKCQNLTYCLHRNFKCSKGNSHRMEFHGSEDHSCRGDFLEVMKAIFVSPKVMQYFDIKLQSENSSTLLKYYQRKCFLKRLHCGQFNTLMLVVCLPNLIIKVCDTHAWLSQDNMELVDNFLLFCQKNGVNFPYVMGMINFWVNL